MKKKLMSFLGIVLALVMSANVFIIQVSAETQHMLWYQKGKKNYLNSYVTTQFDGEVSAKQGTRYGFLWTKKYNDKCYWEGTSSSFWAGLSPYNADSIVHTDTIWIEGSGSPSYSGGLSLGESAGLSVGFSTSSSGMYENFSYQVENSYSIYIDYSYSGSIYDFSYVGQKASATFKFSNSFVVVNSESNQIIEEKSECWFT